MRSHFVVDVRRLRARLVQRTRCPRVGAHHVRIHRHIVFDEVVYEGNIEEGWGNLTPQEMVHRFWVGTVAGCYVGHGETYLHPEDILWWSKGGVLHGQSPARVAFLRMILESGPTAGLDPVDSTLAGGFPCAGKEGDYYLCYFGVHQPAEMTFDLPQEHSYQIDVIDTWEMTVTSKEGTFEGRVQVQLPGRPYTAVRIQRSSTQ